MRLTNLFLFVAITSTMACSTMRYGTGYRDYSEDENIMVSPEGGVGEIGARERFISSQLDRKITIPDSIRLAVFTLTSTSVSRFYDNWYNNEDYLKLKQNYYDTLIYTIRSHPRIKKIINLPSILLNEEPNLTNLRDVALRLQADMLLIISIKSDLYHKNKAFAKDEIKAFSTCEAVLLDIRTGIIPHTSIVTKDYFTKKSPSDFNAQYTRQRAISGAVINSLLESGKIFYQFLNE